MFRKSLVVVLLLGLLTISGAPLFAQISPAQGLSISPAILEVEAESGKSYDLEYLIENNFVKDVGIDVLLQTFQEGSIPGSANVIPFEPEKDLSYWLTVPKVLNYKQGERRKESYQLNVPDTTAPGAYFFAIVYQPQSQDTQTLNGSNSVVLKTQIATLLFVNVGGDVSKKPSIENFDIGNYWVDPFFDTVPIKYSVLVKGNSFYRPTGNIFLEEVGNDSITTLSSITSSRLILPNGKRDYNYCVQSGVLIFAKKCSEGDTNLGANVPLFGQRQIALRLDFTDGESNPQSVVAQKTIFIIPYKVASFVLTFALLWWLIYLFVRYIKQRNYARRQT